MLEIIKSDVNFDYVGKFKFTAPLSVLVVVASLVLLFSKMQYGVDFRGGAEVQLKFAKSVEMNEIRKSMNDGGFKGVSVQTIGEASDNEVLLKVQGDESNLNQITADVEAALLKTFADSGVDIRKVDIVGPKAGAQLRISGFQAMLWALIAIMIYIGLRFDFKYSPGAIVASFTMFRSFLEYTPSQEQSLLYKQLQHFSPLLVTL